MPPMAEPPSPMGMRSCPGCRTSSGAASAPTTCSAIPEHARGDRAGATVRAVVALGDAHDPGRRCAMNTAIDREQGRRVRVERGVYRQLNGKYAVCFMLDGKPRFRTVDGSLEEARGARARLALAAQAGLLPACPRLTFATVAARWLERFETMVAVGERRERTLESHRYHLDRHLLPGLGRRRIATITVDDIAGLIRTLAGEGRAPRTIGGALATLGSILRYALRRGYITDSPLRRLEAGERPRPAPPARRALGPGENLPLLAACPPRHRVRGV